MVCEDCAVFEPHGFSASEPDNAVEPKASPGDGPCSTCALLKEQEEGAAEEWARLANFRDANSNAIYRRWANLAAARARHRAKAHADEPRGRR